MRQFELLNLQAQRLRDSGRLRDVGSGEEQCELFTSDSSGEVDGPARHPGQLASHNNQVLIALLVTRGVVQGFEVIYVDEDQREA